MYQPTCALKNSVLLDLLPPDWANTATLLLDEVLSAVSSMWTGLWVPAKAAPPLQQTFKLSSTLLPFGWYTSQQVGSGQESSALLRIEFSVEYLNGGNLEESFDNAFNIMLIVFLVAIAFPVFCWKMLRAYRRRKDAQSDQDMFIYIGVALIDVATFALFLVVGLVGLYQLILYKMQAAVFFMIPRDEDLVNFRCEAVRDRKGPSWLSRSAFQLPMALFQQTNKNKQHTCRATVIVAIVGQAVGLLYMLWKQVTVDVFFLDWERPRKVLSRDGGSLLCSVPPSLLLRPTER
eukprot:1147765-Pelagomonas_calceolata.AAC.5